MSDYEAVIQQMGAENDATPASSGADSSADSENPYLSVVHEMAGEIQRAATDNLLAAQSSEPNAAGRAMQLAPQVGVPAPAVEADLPNFERQAQLQTNRRLIQQNPVLAQWAAANPMAVRAAQNQFGDMASIELLASQQLWGAARPVLTQLAKGAASSFNSASLAVNRVIGGALSGVDTVTGALSAPTLSSLVTGQGAGTHLSDWWYQNMIAPALANRTALAAPAQAPFGVKAADVVGNMLGTLLQIAATGGAGALGAANEVAAGAEGAAGSDLAQTAQAVGQTVAHGARAMAFPALTSAVNTGTDVYDQTGSLPQAIRAAQMAYATTTLGGVVPLGAPGGLATRLATGFASGAVTGEVSRQAMNLVTPQPEGFDPMNTILSGLSGAILSGVLGRTPVHDGVADAYNNALAAETAERGGAALQQINKLAQASTLRARDPEAFRQFVASVADDGPLADVYVDGRTFVDALHQSGVDASQIPGLPDRLTEAVASGGDVQIPLEDYATHIAGTPLDAVILPHVKTEEGGLTYAEGQQFYRNAADEMQARAQDVVGQQADADQRQGELQKIGDNLLEQMRATGRYPDDVARASLVPVVEFYRTMSERLGMTPEQVFEQYPLRVAGEDLGESLRQDGEESREGPFGPIYDQFKGDAAGAIAHLREQQAGEATGALHHADIGDIDLVWGKEGTNNSDGYGLAKLLRWHPEVVDNLQDVLSSMSVVSRGQNRVRLESADHEGAVRLDWDGVAKKWLMTAYEKGNRKGGAADPTTNMTGAEARDDSPARAPEDIVDQQLRRFYQGENAPRGAFAPDSRTIALLKGADLSTFLHEAGHFFLTTLGDIAARPDAPAQIRDDMQTAIEWMGGKDLADWQSRTLDGQRDMHEKFARGFEAYLMEGRAPTHELQGLLARFRSWLINVYRSVASLGAQLTPEVRGVFDRLLASDEAIRQSEQLRGYAPLDLSQSGATDAQRERYTALGEQATRDALDSMQARSLRDLKWASNARSKALKALQREADELRNEARRDATREVMSRPVYQAWQFLTLNGREEGTQALPKPREASSPGHVDPARDSLFEAIAKLGGLNRDEVKAQWGVDHREMPDSGIFGKPILRKAGGLSIDRMAERLLEEHYLDEHDLTEFEEKFDAERGGRPQYSWDHQYAAGEAPVEPLDLESTYHGKLSTADLKNMFGEAPDAPWRRLSRLGMTSDRVGLDSDLLAETFGFGSGREFVELLSQVDSPYNAIKRRTDELMLARHGEMTDPAALEQAASEVVHNEARARFMATGLKLLAKSAVPARDLVRAATEVAETAVAGKRVRDLNPRQYEVAETKANRQALELAPRDPAAAVQAQRQALLSNRLAKAARDAVSDVQKILTSQARYDKASIRSKMDPDVLEQIDALRDRFDFRRNPPEGPTRQQMTLQTWVDSQKALGYVPVQHPDMMNPAVRMHYRDMTVEQLRGFNDTIRSMEQIARERKSIMLEGQKVDLRLAVDELVGKMKARGEQFTAQQLVDRPRAGTDPRLRVALDRMTSFLRAAVAEGKPQQFKANQFDMHELLGPFSRMIFERVFNANYRKIDMLKALANEFRAGAKELGRDWQNSLSELVPNRRLLDVDLTEEAGAPVYRRLTRGDLLGIARHVGNESNFDKLTKGMGWRPEDIWAFLNENMTPSDWRATQITWDAFEKHWPDMVEMNRRLGNVSPERVEPRPFRTASGIDMRGGYAPIDYDPVRSKLAMRKSDASAINPSEGLFGRGYFFADTTTNGSLNARIANYYDRLTLDFHSIERRLHDTIHDLAYREALLDVHKILTDPGFRRQFQLTYGPEQYRSLQQWVGDLANGQNADAQMSRLGQLLQATRHMVVANGIALRVSTMVKHGGSALAKSSGYFSGSGQKYFAARVAQMATDHAGMTSQATEKFSEIRARALQQDRDYRETTSSLFQPEGFQSRAERFGHSMVANLDLLSAVPTAWAAYDRAITEGIPVNRGGTGKPMTEAQAVEYANQIVREAHGSNIESARSMLLQSRSEMTKMFTMMYGFMNNSLGQTLDMADKLRTEGFSRPEVLARFLAATIMPALMAGVVEGRKDDEGWAGWAAKAITGEVAGMVPVLRDAWAAVKGYPDSGLAPLMQALAAGGKPFRDAWKAANGETVRAPIKDFGNAIGLAIPGLGQIGSTLQYAADLYSGAQQPESAGDVARGLLFGQEQR